MKKMHILHISNSYGGTEVYSQLIRSLDQLGVKQTVFVPLNPKNIDRQGSQLVNFTVPGSVIIYSTDLKFYHRYMYDNKIDTVKKSIEKQVDIRSVSLIHASLFCSDGAVAFKLSKKYKIPYMVTVRNTDVNLYYRKMWWKRSYFHSILNNSRYIIFISHQYKQSFLKLLSNKNIKNIDEKSIVIPNGVNEFYLNNRVKDIRNIHVPIRIVYAGAFNRGKNILETIHALESLTKKGYNINFTAIGRGLKHRREDEKYLKEIYEVASTKNWINFLDSMPKEKLRVVFEKSDIFVMPSTPETFGIVYVEALSQGLPIVYANGQGFDGYYSDKNIGYGVDPKNSGNIANKIEYIINNYPQISLNVRNLNLEEDFSWKRISERYLNLYNKVLTQ